MRNKHIVDDTLKYEYCVFENSDVYNYTKGKQVKPSKDKRRPNEPPIIYLRRKDGSRVFIYLDQLIAQCFMDDYKEGQYVHHIDGNKSNCTLDNLLIGDGLKLLKEAFNETKEWKLVSIPERGLYYEYYICEDGRLFNATTGAFVKPFEDKRKGNYGNLRYNLYYGKSSNELLHYSASRLVALHFIQVHPPDKDQVLFKDRDHSNLHYNNLFWGDYWDSINQDMPEYERDEIRALNCLSNNVMGKEKWKSLEIPGVELSYEYLVSNFGRVYNKDRGFYCSIVSNISTKNSNNQSYKRAMIKTSNGYEQFQLHRLVAFMFCKNDNPEQKIFINHINGNPECNWSINLEWCTPLENVHHACETNLYHTNIFDGVVTDHLWRENTIIAWIYSLKNVTNDKAYEFYISYLNHYDDNISFYSKEEFVNVVNTKMNSDKDFIRLFNFYKSEYS